MSEGARLRVTSSPDLLDAPERAGSRSAEVEAFAALFAGLIQRIERLERRIEELRSPEPEPPIITAEQAAALLHRSVDWVYRQGRHNPEWQDFTTHDPKQTTFDRAKLIAHFTDRHERVIARARARRFSRGSRGA